MISLNNASRYFETEEIRTAAVRGVSLSIGEGEFVAVVGASGSGKSTLLHLLGFLDTLSEGTYRFDGIDVSTLSTGSRDELRFRNMGFVFQDFNLIDELTVFENVELPLVYAGKGKRERIREAERVLAMVGMLHRRNHYPCQLSGGQQQRVAVARAIVGDPRVILADEPTGNLDSSNGQEILDILKDCRARGKTVVMVTHSEEYSLAADRVIRFSDGEVVS